MVSTLDTLPAVSLWDVLSVDWLPVVSFLDTLPACQPVSLCRVLLLVFVGVVPWCYSARTFYLCVCRGLCRSVGWSAC